MPLYKENFESNSSGFTPTMKNSNWLKTFNLKSFTL